LRCQFPTTIDRKFANDVAFLATVKVLNVDFLTGLYHLINNAEVVPKKTKNSTDSSTGYHHIMKIFWPVRGQGINSNMYKKILCSMVLMVSTLASAAPVSGQGTWESTLLGRDINGQEAPASSAEAVFLYDTALNITWLKNANANGQMTWPDAQSWASSLQVGGFTGWRLPITAIPDASCGASNGYPAVYSQGYDIGCTGSEMGHLFNVSLGNVPDAPISNTGNFGNVQNYYYWSGTPVASNSYYVWTYQTSINGQGYTGTGTNPFFSFAVRDGDVIAATTSTTTTTTTTTTSTTSTSQAPTTTTTVATTTTTTLIPGGEQIDTGSATRLEPDRQWA